MTGNMWAQSWLPLYDICEPYPNKPSVDITPALVEQVRQAKSTMIMMIFFFFFFFFWGVNIHLNFRENKPDVDHVTAT